MVYGVNSPDTSIQSIFGHVCQGLRTVCWQSSSPPLTSTLFNTRHDSLLPPFIHSTLRFLNSRISRTCAVERPWTSGSQKQHNVPNSQYINPSRIMHELSTITRQCTRTLWGQQPRIKATQTKLVKIRWWNQRFLFQGSINLICSALSFWSRSHYRFSDVTCPCFILF